MIVASWKISWNEYAADTYLYGSEMTYHSAEDVEYHNELMPPGTIIKQWYSKTNYQAQRIEPALPMIDGESKYNIILDLDVPDGELCMVRLVFYDRYENEAGSITVRDKEEEFKCPLKTYSYSMQLINGGVTQFHFHSIILQEIIDESEDEFKETK